jgi:hypothetical protein
VTCEEAYRACLERLNVPGTPLMRAGFVHGWDAALKAAEEKLRNMAPAKRGGSAQRIEAYDECADAVAALSSLRAGAE